MAYNKELIQTDLNNINLKLVKEAIALCFRDGITDKAPMGCAGDSVVLFGKESPTRVCLVSVRNHNHSPQLLITDKNGRFVFYGTFHIGLGVDFIAKQFMSIFKLVKFDIESELPSALHTSKNLQ